VTRRQQLGLRILMFIALWLLGKNEYASELDNLRNGLSILHLGPDE
jgi:hypothetical protein